MAVLLVAPEIFIPMRRAGAEFHASTEGQAAAARVVEVLATPVPRPAKAGRRRTGPCPRPRRRSAGVLTVDGLGVLYETPRARRTRRRLVPGPTRDSAWP